MTPEELIAINQHTIELKANTAALKGVQEEFAKLRAMAKHFNETPDVTHIVAAGVPLAQIRPEPAPFVL